MISAWVHPLFVLSSASKSPFHRATFGMRRTERTAFVLPAQQEHRTRGSRRAVSGKGSKSTMPLPCDECRGWRRWTHALSRHCKHEEQRAHNTKHLSLRCGWVVRKRGPWAPPSGPHAEEDGVVHDRRGAQEMRVYRHLLRGFLVALGTEWAGRQVSCKVHKDNLTAGGKDWGTEVLQPGDPRAGRRRPSDTSTPTS